MKIDTLRLTFLATETILDLQRGAAAAAPLAALTSEPGYVQAIDDLQQGKPAPLDLRLPWPYPAGHHFWDAYLEGKLPGDADGKHCFQRLVPLRLSRLDAPPVADLVSVKRVDVEGFYYPHGTGLMVTATVEGPLTLAEAGDVALQIRYDKLFKAGWPGLGAGVVGLDQLMTAGLDRLRDLGFGKGPSGMRGPQFSIATVIRGDEVGRDIPLADGDPVLALLNGLANWVRQWQKLPPPKLEAGKTRLDIRSSTAFAGDILYAGRRGRVVWFPGLFLPGQQARHQLGCYHRNLCFAALQTESLLTLAAAVEQSYAAPTPVPNSIQKLGRLAAGLLGRLYGGAGTYRSDSVRAQIAQSAQLAEVNALRKRSAMAPPLQ